MIERGVKEKRGGREKWRKGPHRTHMLFLLNMFFFHNKVFGYDVKSWSVSVISLSQLQAKVNSFLPYAKRPLEGLT